jgi:hypothetical protein
MVLVASISTPIAPTRVILDPSVLFTDEALEWLRNPELQPFLAVSYSLLQRLDAGEFGDAFAPYAEPSEELAGAVRGAIAENSIATYSYERALNDPAWPDEARGIVGRLLEENPRFGDVLADEWAFVSSQSIAVIWGKIRDTLEAFAKAGAEVYEQTREEMGQVLDAVRDHIPEPVLNGLKTTSRYAKKVPNWLLLGGAIAGAAVAVLAWPMVAVEASRVGIIVIAGDP